MMLLRETYGIEIAWYASASFVLHAVGHVDWPEHFFRCRSGKVPRYLAISSTLSQY
jgi:hypothetical protein